MRGELHNKRTDGGARAVDHGRSDDHLIAALAGRQRGVVSHAQLVAAGIDRGAIWRRTVSGRLHRVHRGVYLVGHVASSDGAREMAAVLACGAGAAVSHLSAATLWKLLPHPAKQRPVDITVAGRHPGRRPGIRVHRVVALDRRDVRVSDNIPLTSPARTLLDLAADAPANELDRAFAEAQVRRLVSARGIADQLERNPGRAGVANLRRLVETGPAPTRSEAERRFLRLIRAAYLPSPRVNATLGRYEVDFLWPAHRVVVEVDGYAYHSNRRAFERDRERGAQLVAAGYTVLRITWRQLTTMPAAVVARVAAALSARG